MGRPGAQSYFDEKAIRRAVVQYHVPVITTLSAARAAIAVIAGIEALQGGVVRVTPLQELHAQPGLFAKGVVNNKYYKARSSFFRTRQ